jgi:hypothetical protein
MITWVIIGLLAAILLVLLWIAVELAIIRANVVGLLQIGATRFQFADEVAEQHLAPLQASIDRLGKALKS